MNFSDWLLNIKSGFFIALIALPLCLGIAMASSFPPIAGVMTAIIGGIVVSLFGGCKLSIKGPAAGLIVIILATVTELGDGDIETGYKRCLAVCVVAAIIQIIFALLRFGRYGRLMPPSVIHGMLAAIGIIIIAKQVHLLIGATPHSKTPFALISEIPKSILNINPELAFIGIITLILMIVLQIFKNPFTKIIPPALIALLFAIPLGLYWNLNENHSYVFLNHVFNVGPNFLVNIPKNILGSFVFPDFSVLLELRAYKFVVMLAVIGSVESVLTVIAVDAMSKNKEKSSLDRDLLAVGIGNFLCAIIGALPMISEVVRSKANIDSGAKSLWSNFFHGVFLLLAISLAAPIIREIPVATLAAMLIVVGIKLASPATFLNTYKIGLDQLILFLTTIIVTLLTDLLLGVLCGVALKFLIHLYRGVKIRNLFDINYKVVDKENYLILFINGPAIFSNYFCLQKQINKLFIINKPLFIDFSEATLVDHTTLSGLYSLVEEVGEQRLQLISLDKLRRSSDHHLATFKRPSIF